MIIKLLFILPIIFFGYSASAETVASKLKGNLKLEGSASIEINATPLVDEKVIEKSKDKLVTIINYANNQSQIVKKKNKNRKPRTKFKGGPEEIFEKFAKSVVYIENQKDTSYIIKGLSLNANPLITNISIVSISPKLPIFIRR